MAENLSTHGGHAYAPGFEPGFWDGMAAYFDGTSPPAEPLIALFCCFAATAVLVSRIRRRRDKRRKTPLFPSLDSVDLNGPGQTLQPKSRKRTLEERQAVFDEWASRRVSHPVD